MEAITFDFILSCFFLTLAEVQDQELMEVQMLWRSTFMAAGLMSAFSFSLQEFRAVPSKQAEIHSTGC